MQVVITTAPDLLVTVDEVKVALGESGNDRNGLIETLLLAAQGELDGPKGWVGISVAEQSITATFDSFDDPVVRLPGGPIVGDVVVTYLDASGAEQTLAPSSYVVAADGTLTLSSGSSWPPLYGQAGAAQAAYDVGIPPAEGDARPDVRISLMKTAIILHVRMSLDMVDVEKVRKAIEALVRPMWVPVL